MKLQDRVVIRMLDHCVTLRHVWEVVKGCFR